MHTMVGDTTEEFRELLTNHVKVIIGDEDVLDAE